MKTPLVRSFLLSLLLLAAPAALHAQLPKIFVASFGNDANDGTRNAPKRNFQAAHNAAAAGGQIVVLDTAGYGTLTITKSIAVTVPPGVSAFVTTTAGVDGITISAGASDVVSLSGLIVESVANAAAAIRVNTAGSLSIENCLIRTFQQGLITQNTTALQLYVHDTITRGCSTGMNLMTSAAVNLTAVVTGCRMEQNSFAGVLTGPFSGSNVDVTLNDCTISGNLTGIQSGGTIVRANNCTITGNGTGVSGTNTTLVSRNNNTLEKNAAGNTGFPGSYSAK